MSNVIYCAILLGITLSFFKSTSANICTKEGLVQYEKLRLNSTTNVLIPINVTISAKIKVCCEGYLNVGTPLKLKCEKIQSTTSKPSTISTPTTAGIHSDSQVTEYPEPICDPPCGPNGMCYDTNRCACDIGYKFSDVGSCVVGDQPISETPTYDVIPSIKPADSGSCINGERDGFFCYCSYGYHLKQGNCLPICSDPCANSQCTAPNKCGCDNGYQYNANTLRCEPICNGKTDELNGCTQSESLKWMWHLLWIPTAGIAIVSFYFLIRRFARATINRLNGENELYFFSDNNPSATGNHKEIDKNGYVKGELSSNGNSMDRTVVIIDT